MRRIYLKSLLLTVLTLSFPVPSFAFDEFVIKINGNHVIFPDEKPFVNQDDRTMTPLRFVTQDMGYQVSWNQDTKEVTVQDGKDVITLTNNSDVIIVNNDKRKMDTEMIIKNGRSFVPIRFIADSFDTEIVYNSMQEVEIHKKTPAPMLNTLDIVTKENEEAFILSGKGLANARIDYLITDERDVTITGNLKVDETGNFEGKVDVRTLSDGLLSIEITQTKYGSQSPKIHNQATKNTRVPDKKIPSPILNELDIVTQRNQETFILSGKGLEDAGIDYLIKDEKDAIITGNLETDESGNFEGKVDVQTLSDGLLSVELTQTKDGSQSPKLNNQVTKNTRGPEITISALDSVVYNNQSNYKIEGVAEPENQLNIIISDKNKRKVVSQANADEAGKYETSMDIKELENGTIRIQIEPISKEGNVGTIVSKEVEKNSVFYELTNSEQERWNISNDGSHPVETTKGFNDALQWAKQSGVITFKVPAGNYLVKKADPILSNDPSACINLVPNITFSLDEQAIIEKETNGKEIYNTVCLGDGVDNVTLKGGQYKGDKDTHDYSQKENANTSGKHEVGTGISILGAKNVTIDGVKVTQFTGGGLAVNGYGTLIQGVTQAGFELGSIDESGTGIVDSTKIRTKDVIKLNKPILQTEMYFEMSNAKNIPYTYNVFFYKEDGSFLSSYSVQKPKEVVSIPLGASSFKAVFDKTSTTGVTADFWNKVLPSNVTIKNSEFAFNRRQGISVGGADNLQITRNKLHDNKGVGTETGIILEGRYTENGMMNQNILIKENEFYENNRYDILLADGQHTMLKENYLGSKGKYGVFVSTLFTDATIKDNTFDGTSADAAHDVTFIGNTMNNSITRFDGPNIIIDGMTFNKSELAVKSNTPFGIEIKNVILNDSALNIWLNPIHVSRTTLNGDSKMGGQAPNGSIFDDLKILNSVNGTTLVRGIYNNCVFEGKTGTAAGMRIDYDGDYELNGCTFKGDRNTFNINPTNANVTIQNSTFDTMGDAGSLKVAAGNKINILNNKFQSKMNAGLNKSVIMIGDYWQKDNPYKVQQVLIQGNAITTEKVVDGITTIYGGVGAPDYQMEDNLLYKAKLNAKATDIQNNNQEL
ncbi:stalk domain-containing protein [Bacillus thuringiensis]|uniref:stalk domain-containing protein n=1 Tax=Bacillus thuringiensis TaxID=1428 RepID=UPI0021D67EF1|nr:stalk domain-containing protein [Bacillus thuringiensis]MCU7667545.1 stalk domain-containing protein [Bacillus thuringiensis]